MAASSAGFARFESFDTMLTGEIAAYLVLEDGQVFEGIAAGASGTAVGMLSVETSMTGYEKIMLEAANGGKLLVFTSPHVGNCGRTVGEVESPKIHAAGVVMRELARRPSNHLAKQSLADWLAEQGTVGICGIDTRAVTRYLREHGAMRGVIVQGGGENQSEVNKSRINCLETARIMLGLESEQ